MQIVLNFLLIRFGLIVGALTLLTLLMFAIAVRLKRQGRLGDGCRQAAILVRGAARLLDDRDQTRRRTGTSRDRGGLASAAMKAAGRYLDDHPHDSRATKDT